MKRFLRDFRQCPDCESTWVRGSGPEKWIEVKVYPKIGLRPFRCEKCGRRYIGLKRQRRIDKVQL